MLSGKIVNVEGNDIFDTANLYVKLGEGQYDVVPSSYEALNMMFRELFGTTDIKKIAGAYVAYKVNEVGILSWVGVIDDRITDDKLYKQDKGKLKDNLAPREKGKILPRSRNP